MAEEKKGVAMSVLAPGSRALERASAWMNGAAQRSAKAMELSPDDKDAGFDGGLALLLGSSPFPVSTWDPAPRLTYSSDFYVTVARRPEDGAEYDKWVSNFHVHGNR
jgi:hypothetical protein